MIENFKELERAMKECSTVGLCTLSYKIVNGDVKIGCVSIQPLFNWDKLIEDLNKVELSSNPYPEDFE